VQRRFFFPSFFTAFRALEEPCDIFSEHLLEGMISSPSSELKKELMAPKSYRCTLGSYLALRSGEGGRTYRYDIAQGIEMGRASEIVVEVILAESGKTVEKVLLSGTAVKVTEGTLML